MDGTRHTELRTYRTERSRFEQTVLLLQGGGALGSYQAGVYQALAQADLHPDWVAGISIGAINAALIAGNPPEKRVERLRQFWEAISASAHGFQNFSDFDFKNDAIHSLINQTRALGVMMFGASDFFKPRMLSPLLCPSQHPDQLSWYDTAPLKATLERLVDFDLLNRGDMRFSVGAVNVRTGNFAYFENTTHTIEAAHIIASGSLPPGFPATKIDGEYYWDGGLVSNTPLQWVLDSLPRKDTLAFQVDLWSSRGQLPKNLAEAEVRVKEIQFSSRTRAATDQYKKAQKLRIALAKLLKEIPAELHDDPEVRLLAAEADEKVCNIVHLIYNAKNYEGVSKDYEFSRRTMEEHWEAGYTDICKAVSHPEVMRRPHKSEGVRTFDWAHRGPE